MSSPRPDVNALMTELGRELQTRWRTLDNDHRAFPDLAVQLLEAHAPAEHLAALDVAQWALGADALPEQQDPSAEFGEPPVTLFAGRGFFIAALYWLDGSDVTIHQHSFNGAFQVLEGSSLHARYSFAEHRHVSGDLRLGVLSLDDVEVLVAGDTRPIRPGRAGIHGISHVGRPSLTLVVRQYTDLTALPLYTYLPPAIEYHPEGADQTLSRQLQLLELLARIDSPAFEDEVRALAATADAFTALKLVAVVGSHSSTLVGDIVEIVRGKGDELADALAGAAAFLRRERAIIAARARARGPGERLLLAALTCLPHRADILRLIATQHPGHDPAQLAARWAGSIIHSAHGFEVSPVGQRAIDALIAGAGDAPAVAGLSAREATAIRYLVRDSAVFSPLFAGTPEASRGYLRVPTPPAAPGAQ